MDTLDNTLIENLQQIHIYKLYNKYTLKIKTQDKYVSRCCTACCTTVFVVQQVCSKTLVQSDPKPLLEM